MKAKNVKCKKCNGVPEVAGSDHTNEYGPWLVYCTDCGEETLSHAYKREAWANWKSMNAKAHSIVGGSMSPKTGMERDDRKQGLQDHYERQPDPGFHEPCDTCKHRFVDIEKALCLNCIHYCQ